MKRSKVLEKVIEIIANGLNIDEENINEETDLVDDLEADSLDAVELTMAHEEESGIEISDEDSSKMTKVEKIVDFIFLAVYRKEKGR